MNAISFSPPSLSVRKRVRKELSKNKRANGPVFEWLSGHVAGWHSWIICDSLICGDNPILVAMHAAKRRVEGESIAIHCGKNEDPFWGYPLFFEESRMTKQLLAEMKIGSSPEDVFPFSYGVIRERGDDAFSMLDPKLDVLNRCYLENESQVVTLGMPYSTLERKNTRISQLRRHFEKVFYADASKVTSKHGYLHVVCKKILVCGGTPGWIRTSAIETEDRISFTAPEGVELFGGASSRPLNMKCLNEQTVLDFIQAHPFKISGD